MTDGESEFLRAGITHFPDAFNAVEQFRTLIRSRVAAAFLSSPTEAWKPLTGRDIKASRSVVGGLWCGAQSKVVLSLPATAPAVVEVGIWWNPPPIKAHAVVICGYFWDGPPAVCRAVPPTLQSGVGNVLSGSTAHFFLPPSADLDADLREMVKALAAAALSVPASG
ncbi:MAG: hypothetical protein EPO40_21970 [Myxococcaceae bacterium]|nr:MAG: hypothetical protein EPO40_21970 [Myxococcaceae bacterium]